MPLPKRNAEEGRVSLYEGHFYFRGFACSSQGVEAGHGAKEKEASGAPWEPHLVAEPEPLNSSRSSAKPRSWYVRATY